MPRHHLLGVGQSSHAGLFLFGFGGEERSNASSASGVPASSKARKAVESNAVFKSRTEQVRGTRTCSQSNSKWFVPYREWQCVFFCLLVLITAVILQQQYYTLNRFV